MPHHQFRMLLILGLLLSGLSVARAASYTFTTLDVPGALHTQAWGINDRGHIAGLYVDNSANQDNHGFLYDGSRFTPLNVPFPGTILTRALGISNPGHIVGVYEAHGFEEGHGFLYIRVYPY